MKISIKGIGVLGGFGAGPAMLEHELVNPTKMVTTVSMESSKGRIEVPALLADTSGLTDYLGKRALRRAGHYIRMALLSSFCALEDAGMLETERRGMGIIVATGYGATCNTFDFQQSVIDSDDPCGSPTKFANSVHNAAAGNISLFLNEIGPNLSVSPALYPNLRLDIYFSMLYLLSAWKLKIKLNGNFLNRKPLSMSASCWTLLIT